jgi:S-(hydroxymethyl)glutathione dehydrogenase / alcohol dehydrogenase
LSNFFIALFDVVLWLPLQQAAKARGASRIFAIDLNESKFQLATELGATDCINPKELPEGTTVQSHIVSLTK